MKVLMFGWEFPPFNSGGLGTACYGLTHGLSKIGVEITFIVPKSIDAHHDFLKIKAADIENVKIRGITSILSGYITSKGYQERITQVKTKKDPSYELYGKNLFEEVERYAKKAKEIAREEYHDVIHAHEWLTFKAGIAAKAVSGKPLIVHVHATEFDRTADLGVNQYIYDVERAGMHAADSVIAVSNFTKSKIIKHYGINPEKIQVVHNAIDFDYEYSSTQYRNGKTVLYLGRVTPQKGPDYFIEAAKKVLEKEPDARFVVAGSGDMESSLIEKAVQLGIHENIVFTGFLRGSETKKAYEMANLYVMPSVSEPFGLTPLEAASNKTPVIISKQSGVSEIFSNCLRVDFWDTNQMANKMLAVLQYKELQESLSENGYEETSRMSWISPAKKCLQIYNDLCSR